MPLGQLPLGVRRPPSAGVGSGGGELWPPPLLRKTSGGIKARGLCKDSRLDEAEKEFTTPHFLKKTF